MKHRSDNKANYTIDDIARELGISKTTVSRAISGKGRIGADTRGRVLEYIEKINYRPNAMARSLAHNQAYNIGLLLPDISSFDNFSFFHQSMHGICEVAASFDYDVLISTSGENSNRQLERIISNHKVDGIIFSRSTIDSPESSILKEAHIPFVTMGYSPDPEAIYVDNANRAACLDLTSQLILAGNKSIALLGGSEDFFVSLSRLDGYKAAYKRNQLPIREELIFMNIAQSSDISPALDSILAHKVDCIICMDEVICAFTMAQLLERGLRIPQDIRIASCYDSSYLSSNNPPITSIYFDAKALGASACSLLLDHLSGLDVHNHIISDYEIRFRDSTKPE